MRLHAGDKLGPHEIVGPIGAGGMGGVYKARDTRLQRTVAVKVLPGAIAKREDLLARFEREARAGASLSDLGPAWSLVLKMAVTVAVIAPLGLEHECGIERFGIGDGDFSCHLSGVVSDAGFGRLVVSGGGVGVSGDGGAGLEAGLILL